MAKRTMAQAIRAYCLECSNHRKKEVELCPMKKCPLHPYRLAVDQEVGPIQEDDKAEVKSSLQPTLFE